MDSFLNAYSVDLIQQNSTIFSLYYVKRGLVANDLICEVHHDNSNYAVKVNDVPILDHTVKNYLPRMLFVKGVDNDFLIVAVSVNELKQYKIRKSLLLKIYKINYLPTIALLDFDKINLSSSIRSLREEVKYPVVLYQNRPDTIMVIARVDNDDRGRSPDRLYVMWNLRYRDGRFAIIKPAASEGQFNNRYLFKYSGYIGYGKYSDKLIMVSEVKGHLKLLYVGKYLSQDYNFFSNIYEISVDYTLNFGARKCIINYRYECNLRDIDKYNIPVGGIDVINAISNGKSTYLAYVGVVSNSKFGDDTQLVIVSNKQGKQVTIYDFMRVADRVTSLYVVHVDSNIVMTTVSSSYIVRYEIPELQLRNGNVTHINIMQFSRREITNVANFANVITGNISFPSDKYINVTTVAAKKLCNSVENVYFNVRSILSGDIFTTEQSLSSVNASMYETTRSVISRSESTKMSVEPVTSVYMLSNTEKPVMAVDYPSEASSTVQSIISKSSITEVGIKSATANSLSYNSDSTMESVSTRDKFSTMSSAIQSIAPKSYALEREKGASTSSAIQAEIQGSSTTEDVKHLSSDTVSSIGFSTSQSVVRYYVTDTVNSLSIDRNDVVSSITDVTAHPITNKKKSKIVDNRSNVSDVKYGSLHKKVKYNVKRSTLKPGIKTSIKEHTFHSDFTPTDYVLANRLNLTNNVSMSDYYLTNNGTDESNVRMDNSKNGLLIGVVCAVFFIVMVLFFSKGGYDRLKRGVIRCLGNGRRTRCRSANPRVLPVLELHDLREISGVIISNRAAYASSIS
ncbi:hypothetical protein [Ehrlichia canis]|uniref:Uncharacterized protein n=1 Tax=Ehrlichia canis (strain Jake) TaxID=269484 RepID=A0ACA6AVB5_EHRCJ|nr:hypothetical protein [Ehrlichia canis]AAZ68190.1 hypothetical protein Ecaj_0139 [Ehrlichia canis str. Jake]AUO55043.1 hypothetical protein C1I72_04230 [Ehrlichia canis]UKC53019.1 hypothetical protein s20019040002_000061 [Ehrlichia canis]UKC53956.1 hypothetical protein s20026770001_000061 [Ehrlichia canis]UKC54892.1 hypothetical protein s21009500007_000061 [Ehrlichia canis]